MKEKNEPDGMRELKEKRFVLLEQIHKIQQELDRVDYLIYQKKQKKGMEA